jgi:hypothetical protein
MEVKIKAVASEMMASEKNQDISSTSSDGELKKNSSESHGKRVMFRGISERARNTKIQATNTERTARIP